MSNVIYLEERFLEERVDISFYIENTFLNINYSDFKLSGKKLENLLIASNENFRNNFLFLSNSKYHNLITKSKHLSPQISEIFQRFIRDYSLTSKNSSEIFNLSSQTALIFYQKKEYSTKPKIIIYYSKKDPKRLYFFGNKLNLEQVKILKKFNLNKEKLPQIDFRNPLIERIFEYKIPK